MIQIRVQCGCGQKYAFDVEPVDNRMPSPVYCPVCGAEGTAAANEMIAQHLLVPSAAALRFDSDGINQRQEQSSSPEPEVHKPPSARASTDARRKNKWLFPAIAAGCVVMLGAAFVVRFFQRQTHTIPAKRAIELGRSQPPRAPAQDKGNDALPTLNQTPHREDLETQIAKAKEAVARYHGGHVVIGRVMLDGPGDPREVGAQMEILAGGYFAGETKDLERPIGFRLHGYAPLDLELKGKEGELVDVGAVHMTPLPASRLCTLTGKLSFLGLVDPTKVEVLISIMGGPVNTPNGGSSPRPHSPWPVHLARLDAKGCISATGFTPVKYWCRIKGPDLVEKQFPISFTEGQTFDLGTVQVEQSKPFEVTYVLAEKRPFDLRQKKEVTLRCMAFGTAKLKATSDPARIDLLFEQRNGTLFFRSIGVRCGLTELGMGPLKDFVEANPGPGSNPDQVPVHSGHAYLLNNPYGKNQVLFRVDLEPKVASSVSERAKMK